VQAQQVPVRVEEHDSAVEGATVPFDDTDDGMHAPGGLGDQIEVGPGYGDRPVVIAAEPVTALIGPLPHHRSERMTLRVPADERLASEAKSPSLVMVAAVSKETDPACTEAATYECSAVITAEPYR